MIRLLCLWLLLSGLGQARPAIPGIGGMVRLGPGRFLVVHDTKAGQTDPYFGLLETAEGLSYRGLTLLNHGEVLNDLESICPLPGRPDEYLVSESRQFQGRFGRLFRVRVIDPAGAAPQVEILGQQPLPVLPGQVEGLACLALERGRWLLLLGGRGGDPAYSPGRLHWGVYSCEPERLQLAEEGLAGLDLTPPAPSSYPFTRGISDLYLDAADYLWVSSADEMADRGPFRSVVYRAGRVERQTHRPLRSGGRELVWVLDGLKVEAVAAPDSEQSVLSVGTDDEDFGGIWRLLPPASAQPGPPR